MENVGRFKKGTTPWNKGKHGLSQLSGEKHGMFGKTHSSEARKKISIAKKGKPVSSETLKRLKEMNRGSKSHLWKGGRIKKNCLICRKEFKIDPYRNDEAKYCSRICGGKAKIGVPPSIETRKKLSDSHKGEKSHLWKGGLTKKNDSIRKSLEYKLWRESVFKRDNYTCVWCLRRGGKIHADHIKPFAYFPELRFAIDNGRTLCIDCHKTTDTYLRVMKNPL